ncbi:MAG TPA: hypothetical protein VGO40_23535 [Longimicrobium sp.]|jgi:hypothetical protein|nr:hypothetical protein [Longimicrobium sp.]
MPAAAPGIRLIAQMPRPQSAKADFVPFQRRVSNPAAYGGDGDADSTVVSGSVPAFASPA